MTWEEALPLLGTMPDAEIARRLGTLTETGVNRRRQKLGIARYHVPARCCRVCPELAVCRADLCHTHNERWKRWGKPPLEEWCAAFREERLCACEICGKQWNGYPNRRTCGHECDMERRRRIALARWHEKSAQERARLIERSTQLSSARRRVEREAREVEHVCKACGDPFRGLPWRRFCCQEDCERTHRKLYRTEYRNEYRRQQYRERLLGQMASAEKTLTRKHTPGVPDEQ